MKTIGLIGGMSWESTATYYRMINEAIRDRLGGFHSAKCIVFSVDFAEIELLQQTGQWERAGQILAQAAQRLEKAGAEILLLCTNTMHKCAPEIQAAITIPLLHIADATGHAIVKQNLTTVGLLGTRFTMEERFILHSLTHNFGLNVLVPDQGERQIVHSIIFDELVKGIILDSSRQAYQSVINRLVERGAQGIILGCTEIGLLIRPQDTGVPIFDTTLLHSLAAVEASLQTTQAP